MTSNRCRIEASFQIGNALVKKHELPAVPHHHHHHLNSVLILRLPIGMELRETISVLHNLPTILNESSARKEGSQRILLYIVY